MKSYKEAIPPSLLGRRPLLLFLRPFQKNGVGPLVPDQGTVPVTLPVTTLPGSRVLPQSSTHQQLLSAHPRLNTPRSRGSSRLSPHPSSAHRSPGRSTWPCAPVIWHDEVRPSPPGEAKRRERPSSRRRTWGRSRKKFLCKVGGSKNSRVWQERSDT